MMRELIVIPHKFKTADGNIVEGVKGINPAAVAQYEFYPGAGGKIAGAWFMLIGSENKHMLTGLEAEEFDRLMRNVE